MSGPAKWDWGASNGTASAAATAAAYDALTSGGRTAAFTAPVWNDILAKISAQRVFWTDTAWDRLYPSLEATQMATSDAMTAQRFNTAVKNMPPIKSWPWQSTLGRTDIKPRDRCYGAYFIYLTDGLNYWIDLVPIPVSFANSTSFSLSANGIALPAIHVMVQNPLSAIWTPTITARAAPSASVKYDLRVTQSGELTLSALGIAGIHIINFSHVDFQNCVSVYPAPHVIGALNAGLQHHASVTFGNTVFLQAQLPFSFSVSGRIYLDAALPFYAQVAAGQLSASAAVSLAQHYYFAFNLVSQSQGEPRILELDSVPLSAALEAQSCHVMALTCQDMDRVIAGLNVALSTNAALFAAQTIEAVLALNSALYIESAPSTPESIALSISEISGPLNIGSDLVAANVGTFGADVRGISAITSDLDALDSLLTKAIIAGTCTGALNLITKLTSHIASALLSQSTISIDAGCLRTAHVIETLTERLSILTNAGTLVLHLVKTSINAGLLTSASAVVKNVVATDVELAGALMVSAEATILDWVHTGATTVMQTSLSVAMQKPTVLHSGVEMEDEVSITAAAGIKSMQTTGANVTGLFNLAARGALSVPDAIGANIHSLSTFSASVSPQLTQPISVTLSLTSSLTASVVIPAEALDFVAVISSEHTGTAQIDLINRIAACASMLFSHTGSADTTLAAPRAIMTAIIGRHGGTVAVSSAVVVTTRGELRAAYTTSSTISLAVLALVSDLDDCLVSDLDDGLVTDVEFSVH